MHECDNPLFYLQIVLQTSFLSAAAICQQTWSALLIRKLTFVTFEQRLFLQSYVIMPGGRLPETENKRIYQIFGPKSGRGRLRNLGSGRLRESL